MQNNRFYRLSFSRCKIIQSIQYNVNSKRASQCHNEVNRSSGIFVFSNKHSQFKNVLFPLILHSGCFSIKQISICACIQINSLGSARVLKKENIVFTVFRFQILKPSCVKNWWATVSSVPPPCSILLKQTQGFSHHGKWLLESSYSIKR